MKIICVGGGPAGLYFAICAKLRQPRWEITVLEQTRPGAALGWGFVFWDDLLDDLYRNDSVTAQQIKQAAIVWKGMEVHRQDQTIYLGGYGYSLSRLVFLNILCKRARDLGVDVSFEHTIANVKRLAFHDADLIVAADGANSALRQLHQFPTEVLVGRNRYLWLGTDRVWDSFHFAFERTPAGWIWFYAYPYTAAGSTLQVECTPETWRGLQLNTLCPEHTMRLLSEIFARHLNGHVFQNHRPGADQLSTWQQFRTIRNHMWHRGNVVLLGDAAHTTHFSIGSGTKLALGDAIALAEKLSQQETSSTLSRVYLLTRALQAYQTERQAALLPISQAAWNSALWFEHAGEDLERSTPGFLYALLKRQGHYPLNWFLIVLASQVSVLRRLRRWIGIQRRKFHAARRIAS